MRYEIAIEDYGTISLEYGDGNVLLQLRGDKNSMTFDMLSHEFAQLVRAVRLVIEEMEEQA